jgi:hypothetical protein
MLNYLHCWIKIVILSLMGFWGVIKTASEILDVLQKCPVNKLPEPAAGSTWAENIRQLFLNTYPNSVGAI